MQITLDIFLFYFRCISAMTFIFVNGERSLVWFLTRNYFEIVVFYQMKKVKSALYIGQWLNYSLNIPTGH